MLAAFRRAARRAAFEAPVEFVKSKGKGPLESDSPPEAHDLPEGEGLRWESLSPAAGLRDSLSGQPTKPGT